jgi:hypothetical protein
MSDTTARSISMPYKLFRHDGPFDAIVIGSGIGLLLAVKWLEERRRPGRLEEAACVWHRARTVGNRARA